jgi:hypothetical protein
VHFNARSVINKWEEVTAEVLTLDADIIYITETWLDIAADRGPYNLDGFHSFFNCRTDMRGGGSMILIKDTIRATQIGDIVSQKNAHNICAIKLVCSSGSVLIAAVYRAPWSSTQETGELIESLSNLCSITDDQIITGDLNLPNIDWCVTNINSTSTLDVSLKLFMNEFELHQINNEPSRLSNILDVIITSGRFSNCTVECCPPVANSDHTAQRMNFQLKPLISAKGQVNKLCTNKLINILSNVN